MVFTVHVQVKPASSQAPLVQQGDNSLLIVHVREPAQDGKANKAASKVLADHFAVPPSRVVLTKGHTARYKTFVIHDD